MRRFLITIAVMTAVVAVAAVVVWWINDNGSAAARRAWQPPPSPVLSSPMRVQPIAGWRMSVTDLGLPAPVDGMEQSRIGTDNEPFRSRPFIGNLDDHAYFLASTPATPGPQWWMIGVDVRSGKRLFDPVQLGATTRPPECFLNGRANMLCVNDDSHTAYVVELPSGALAHSGPTDLRLGLGTLAVVQVGIYAIAETHGQGVYGIGPRAETTWFVPGDGHIQSTTETGFETAPQTLAAQLSADPRAYDMTVFSVSDGNVVKPEIDDGAHLGEQRYTQAALRPKFRTTEKGWESSSLMTPANASATVASMAHSGDQSVYRLSRPATNRQSTPLAARSCWTFPKARSTSSDRHFSSTRTTATPFRCGASTT
jgi:hypothetical protein